MAVRDVVQAAAGVGGAGEYVEDVFSTYLYTGDGSTRTITNGIDLDGEGGLVWTKSRAGAYNNNFWDTVMGPSYYMGSNIQNPPTSVGSLGVTSFNADGFTIAGGSPVYNDGKIVSWTLRKQRKFFDIVTWTGNGVPGRTVAHNLGSAPGAIFIKTTNTASDWRVWHRGIATNQSLVLNSTAAVSATDILNNTAPTDSVITLSSLGEVNFSGYTYKAYIFAHDAGGFGVGNAENVISCGSFTPDVFGNATVNLGYEAQWILYKGVSGAGGADTWVILDNMRGWDLTTSDKRLFPSSSSAEASSSCGYPTATGFNVENLSASPYIYIAIRRGPMKTPESGTEVLGLNARTGTGVDTTVTGGSGVTDLAIIKNRSRTLGARWLWASRLTGIGELSSDDTDAEAPAATTLLQANPWDVMDGIKIGVNNIVNNSSFTYINYLINRAPGFFDEVCYTGDGTAGRTVAHNLGVAPELMISKSRSASGAWTVLVNFGSTSYSELALNSAIDQSIRTYASNQYLSSAPSSSSYTINTTYDNDSGVTFVSYLFASCPGVSKVGSYTGTAADLNVDCGFSSGARFVLIKRTDSTGDWYVWDSARGIVAGNDPYLLLNSNDDEVTNTDYVDPLASGFTVTASAPAALNASGGSYIFLAIA